MTWRRKTNSGSERKCGHMAWSRNGEYLVPNVKPLNTCQELRREGNKPLPSRIQSNLQRLPQAIDRQSTHKLRRRGKPQRGEGKRTTRSKHNGPTKQRSTFIPTHGDRLAIISWTLVPQSRNCLTDAGGRRMRNKPLKKRKRPNLPATTCSVPSRGAKKHHRRAM